MPVWHLPSHVHICRSGDWFVIFDIRADRYFAIADGLGELAEDRRSFTCSSASDDQARKLQAQGLLVASPPSARPTETPRRSLAATPTVAFIASMLWAERAARGGPTLERALDELRARKRWPASPPKQDLAAAIEEYAARRIWWPREFVCLFDTLALAIFLMRRGHACDVVFGAKGRPFAAHCWAESAGQILAEDPDFCAGFSEMVRA